VKHYVKPKKHLGQHFLNDVSIADKVASLFKEDGYDLPVLEIGPGTGVLTQYLLQYYKDVSALEIDRESVAYLETHFVPLGLKLKEGDFLDTRNDAEVFSRDMLILGNFPYNISSQIVFRVLDHIDKVKGFGGMFQKEVAERLVAKPGSRTYGILSVFLNTFYTSTYEFTVGPELFTPPPKVHTGVIKCTRIDGFVLPCNRQLFFEVVKTAFNQRRKTLRNALHKFNLQDTHEFAKLRAEQLSSADFIALTQMIEQTR
jgi:16S rRNA (adenine1518-N6/adenine1519-N6)-dimethyltransferase